MSRRKKVLKNVKIETIAAEGRGLGRSEGKVIFVDYGIPGDIVDVRLTKNKKDYALGVIFELTTPSSLRQPAFCDHFGSCGGCRWQHISYDQQLMFKENIVREAFLRIGKVSDFEFLPIRGCDEITGYRNKMEFTFSRAGWFTSEEIQSGEELERRALGFHVAGQYQRVVNVKHCHLQDDDGNEVRNIIYRYCMEGGFSFYDHIKKEGLMRNLTVRQTSTGEMMILLHFGGDDMEAIQQIMDFVVSSYPNVESINYVVNTKGNDSIYDLEVINHAGKDHIVEQLGTTKFRIGPKSFFQTNTRQANLLYDIALDYAALTKDDLVYDLYTGIGSIALYIAEYCKHVVGVETVPEAIEDAWKNSTLNGISNVDFVAGATEKVLTDEFHEKYGAPDVLITDPPRAGMHKNVISFILKASPSRIVYVSCNPVTQARDIQMLSDSYKLVKVQPVDMFPQTYHIENVALLELVK